ncbi:hypothetical protein CC1G_08097 [Coprinopsis cinerea okayama7|uniref:Uncharacterized protein n=1 Tax=Coprinopsis cinerea (strain Okayama-7 / 130 / ATCC MYA-4618 / FGSC 9003) TaxID=240176 RepID=A8NVH1_COPC7|nr:hypothetical protein CC1G_08097 [Coprinopsis cinerea okayama7\|eukprot:XP_001836712.2 hypothetical protein CC1G_08097 [Coprinopsis cinerea okayama7\
MSRLSHWELTVIDHRIDCMTDDKRALAQFSLVGRQYYPRTKNPPIPIDPNLPQRSATSILEVRPIPPRSTAESRRATLSLHCGTQRSELQTPRGHHNAVGEVEKVALISDCTEWGYFPEDGKGAIGCLSALPTIQNVKIYQHLLNVRYLALEGVMVDFEELEADGHHSNVRPGAVPKLVRLTRSSSPYGILVAPSDFTDSERPHDSQWIQAMRRSGKIAGSPLHPSSEDDLDGTYPPMTILDISEESDLGRPDHRVGGPRSTWTYLDDWPVPDKAVNPGLSILERVALRVHVSEAHLARWNEVEQWLVSLMVNLVACSVRFEGEKVAET